MSQDRLFDGAMVPLHPARPVVTVRAPILAQLDSPESVQAGIQNMPRRGSQAARVLAHLESHGPCTDDELIAALGFASARPRRVNLTEKGLVIRVGTGVSSLGNEAALWDVVR